MRGLVSSSAQPPFVKNRRSRSPSGCSVQQSNYITLPNSNVHGANRTHGTESQVFRGIEKKIHKT